MTADNFQQLGVAAGVVAGLGATESPRGPSERAGMSVPQGVTARFESKFIPEPNSGCWIWTAHVNDHGYGRMRVGGKYDEHGQMILAHRLSWVLNRGGIPDHLHVLHRCDVPSCVNPEHLFLGTLDDNNADRHAKGRTSRGAKHGLKRRGEANYCAKLTETDVLAIRVDDRMQSVIANDYGVNRSTIRDIKTRRNWKHLP
jgi:hypothetical protein